MGEYYEAETGVFIDGSLLYSNFGQLMELAVANLSHVMGSPSLTLTQTDLQFRQSPLNQENSLNSPISSLTFGIIVLVGIGIPLVLVIYWKRKRAFLKESRKKRRDSRGPAQKRKRKQIFQKKPLK